MRKSFVLLTSLLNLCSMSAVSLASHGLWIIKIGDENSEFHSLGTWSRTNTTAEQCPHCGIYQGKVFDIETQTYHYYSAHVCRIGGPDSQNYVAHTRGTDSNDSCTWSLTISESDHTVSGSSDCAGGSHKTLEGSIQDLHVEPVPDKT